MKQPEVFFAVLSVPSKISLSYFCKRLCFKELLLLCFVLFNLSFLIVKVIFWLFLSSLPVLWRMKKCICTCMMTYVEITPDSGNFLMTLSYHPQNMHTDDSFNFWMTPLHHPKWYYETCDISEDEMELLTVIIFEYFVNLMLKIFNVALDSGMFKLIDEFQHLAHLSKNSSAENRAK